jgi:hypothetical protein
MGPGKEGMASTSLTCGVATKAIFFLQCSKAPEILDGIVSYTTSTKRLCTMFMDPMYSGTR